MESKWASPHDRRSELLSQRQLVASVAVNVFHLVYHAFHHINAQSADASLFPGKQNVRIRLCQGVKRRSAVDEPEGCHAVVHIASYLSPSVLRWIGVVGEEEVMLTETTVTKLREMHLSVMATALKDQMSDSQYVNMAFEDRLGLW